MKDRDWHKLFRQYLIKSVGKVRRSYIDEINPDHSVSRTIMLAQVSSQNVAELKIPEVVVSIRNW